MSARRRTTRVTVVAAAVFALLAPVAPALAEPREPTSAEMRAAEQRIAKARRTLSRLQVRAQHAAEAYNGAKVRAARLEAARAVDARLAVQAQEAYDHTLRIARAAQAVADAATARADAARAAERAAQQAADEAQRTLDQIAVGAYRTDGQLQLGLIAQMLMADDPVELAGVHSLMNHIGSYQDTVIGTALVARSRAAAAGRATAAAEQDAIASADAATAALTRTTAARDKALTAHDQAVEAADAAARGAREAERARRTALALVARAQAALGSAVRSKAQLEAAARQAREDAGNYRDVDAPSREARVAIHWAFEQIGVPYSWGGGDENGPSEGFAQGAGTVGFDCSGLTLFIYHKAGIRLDHWTGSQWHVGQRITRRADLLPGDLMFFAYDTSRDDTIHHVSIYIGKGRMIEAPYTGEVVRVTSADRSDFIGATRPWA